MTWANKMFCNTIVCQLLTYSFHMLYHCHIPNIDVLNISNIREVLDETWNYRAKWRFIGIELGIVAGTLEAIEVNCRKVEDCLCEMITIWLRCVNPRPTRSAMKAALQSERVLSTTGN